MRLDRSIELFERAKKLFPGGVNSPVRAAVKPYPFYVKRGVGAYLETVDGERLIDYVLGYGPLILGHSHPSIIERVTEQLENGWLYGTPHEAEIILAEKIKRHYGYDMIRFVNSGTEATVTALRIARGYTNRDHIIKFEGCYHGSNDSLLVKAGSAVTHYSIVSSRGIPNQLASLTYVLQYNDGEGFKKFMDEYGDEIAAVILEPVIANTGLIPPEIEFLEILREETERHNTLLIFDEVVTGYRVSIGGAKKYYNIEPDMITLGKIIGGGFPIGAVASSKEIMEQLSPVGKVFNAGTFNAHPISMVAGIAMIEELEKDYVYKVANRAGEKIAEELTSYIERYNIKATVNHLTNMYQIFFTDKKVRNSRDANTSDKKRYEAFHRELLDRGIFIPPSQFETCFTSAMHDEDIIDKTIKAMEEAIKKLSE